MKRIYKFEGVDCANCALKLENNIKKIEGIYDVSVNFMTQKLTFSANDEAVIEKVHDVCKSFEDGVSLRRIG